MPKQKVPHIDCKFFTIGRINKLLDEEKIYVNPDYQRGDIWKLSQKIELIKSIENSYSIGVLVLFVNEDDKFEILDGQQRLLAIKKYFDGKLDLEDSDLIPYENLAEDEKHLINGYCVYYLQLKSHNEESKEEDIVQTFLRLQEGTALNRAEKISAYRGAFKDTFRQVRDTHPLFATMGNDKRFRLRLLVAEMLLLELEGNFDNKIFPSLELRSFIMALKKYEKKISSQKLTFFKGNLDILHNSLSYLLTALTPREALSFYMLVSYLRRHRAGNQNLVKEVFVFAKEFLKILHSFGIYDQKPPKGMNVDIFKKYKSYKEAAKVMTTPESITKRFDVIVDEFNRFTPIVRKDPKRCHDEEQKRTLYFRQEGICPFCNKPMHFKDTSSDHVISHSKAGQTDDLSQAQLLHKRCHERLEKARKKKATK